MYSQDICRLIDCWQPAPGAGIQGALYLLLLQAEMQVSWLGDRSDCSILLRSSTMAAKGGRTEGSASRQRRPKPCSKAAYAEDMADLVDPEMHGAGCTAVQLAHAPLILHRLTWLTA